jgi:dihydrodipicolinate synthase/N-acetylneuraminate lyase
MSHEQFEDVVKVFLETMQRFPETGVQVGCGSASLKQVFRRVRIALDHGCTNIQLPLPGWLVLTDDEVVSFYSAVAKEFPQVRIIVYDNPSSGRKIGVELWPRLLTEVQAIQGAKMSKIDIELMNAIRSARPDFAFFAVESNFLQAWPLGVRSMTAWITYCAPKIINPLWQALKEDRPEEVRQGSELVEKLAQIKTPVRPFGYRAGIIDRLMGLASGFLHPTFRHVLKPWRSIDPEHIKLVREKIVEQLGSQYLVVLER